MDDIIGVEYLSNLDINVKNKLIMEEVERLKVVLETFDTNEYSCFWKLMSISQRIDSLKSERDSVRQFFSFYKSTVESDHFPNNVKLLRSFKT